MNKADVLELLREQFAARITATVETIAIERAVGRILAQPIVAAENAPAFRRSTMDGYAVRAADTIGSSEALPIVLRGSGYSQMGENCTLRLQAGCAVQVATGAMLPEGADAVVMLEYTEQFGQELAVSCAVAPRENIIDIGDDVRLGARLFDKGHKLCAQHIGALAMLGSTHVQVYAAPRVAILSTGDELVDIADHPQPGQVRDVNVLNLTLWAEHYGCTVVDKRRIADDEGAIRAALLEAMRASDITLISGGSSVGEQDNCARIINSLGAPGVLVHGVAIKPGKPTIAARIDDKALFGMPGHPAACIIAFEAVVAPFINEVFYSAHVPREKLVSARAAFQVHGGQGRDVFQMVKLVAGECGYEAHPVHGKSGMLTLLAEADGYIEIPLDKEGLNCGEEVQVKLL